MRALNTLPGQDDSEKLVTNQKQIEELNITVDCLKNELSEKTNRIEELCRLANDFRDDTDRIKTEVCMTLNWFIFFWFSVTANNNVSWFMMLTYNAKPITLLIYRCLLCFSCLDFRKITCRSYKPTRWKKTNWNRTDVY